MSAIAAHEGDSVDGRTIPECILMSRIVRARRRLMQTVGTGEGLL
jgi:hypothetical protein